MKLLLCKNVSKLGIVGDIVDVASGYARNYLLPHGLATEPTEANIRALAEARRLAELERVREREQLAALAKQLEEVEVTIRARANEDGVLYGSVGRKEIAAALRDEGYPVEHDQVVISEPIRHLDNVAVEVRLAEDLTSSVKVWVVRERGDADEDMPEEAEAGKEADFDDNGSDN